MNICIGIINYGVFSRFIEKIEKQLPDNVELVVLNDLLFTELENPIRKLEEERGVNVFVASGSSADFLEKYLKDIPLVRINVTGFDFMNTFHAIKPFSNHAVIITHEKPLNIIDSVRDVLSIEVEEAAYSTKEDLDILLQPLYARGIRDVIGSALLMERASLYEMRGYLIWSDNGVKSAFDTAVLIAHGIQDSAEKARKLNCILDYAAEGIILTDQNGIITDFNSSAERILRRSRKSIIGKSCKEVLPNTQLHKEQACRPKCYYLFGFESQYKAAENVGECYSDNADIDF